MFKCVTIKYFMIIMDDYLKYGIGVLAGAALVSLIAIVYVMSMAPAEKSTGSIQFECASGGTADFSGEWESTWGSMTLEQEDGEVTGTYDYSNGEIEGTVEDNVLEFEWDEGGGYTGDGYFVMSSDCEHFDGQWRDGNSQGWAGSWHAER